MATLLLFLVQLTRRSEGVTGGTMRLEVRNRSLALPALLLCLASALGPSLSAAKHPKEGPAEPVSGPALLWRNPGASASLDLYYGPGGKRHQPRGPFKFVKEDLDGTSPKFVVTDADGVKWKLKLGIEARSETAATRIIWAAGYFANEDYFLADIQVAGMPARVHRGRKLMEPGGVMHNVRMKREDEKKIGTWKWKDAPFTGSREWNGLRTLMALLNNWDLKDENNAIYRRGDERIYMVSDVGATFGTAGRAWPPERAKDNLYYYANSNFIRRTTPATVDFQSPARPGFKLLVNPKEYISRVRLEWIGRNVPRTDAKWLGQLLGRLSPGQIRDAFRASGCAPAEIEGFSEIIRQRIARLMDL